MKFKYRIIWTDTSKNRQEWCDMPDQNIAIFVAKKKVNDGMQNVIIQVTGEWGNDADDSTWPAIDAEIEEAKGE